MEVTKTDSPAEPALPSSLVRLQEAEKQFSDFIDFIELLICRRCYRTTYDLGKPYHHHGAFLYLLERATKVSRPELQNWLDDVEHGFVHGLCTLFWIIQLMNRVQLEKDITIDCSPYSQKQGIPVTNYSTRKLKAERIIVGALFHDFLRSQGRHANHDKELTNYFDYLDAAFYTHSNPKHDHHPIVKADRIELLRYKNSASWVDMSIVAPYLDKIGGTDKGMFFYKNIRPILEKMIACRNDVWFSHVVESGDPIKDFYPTAHWEAIDQGLERNPRTTGYSVNSGFLPVTDCLGHTWKTHKNKKGIIGLVSKTTADQFTTTTAAPLSTWGRDHPFLADKIPIEEWIFLYDEDIMSLQQIEQKDIKAMDLQLFNRAVKVVKNLESKIIAMMC